VYAKPFVTLSLPADRQAKRRVSLRQILRCAQNDRAGARTFATRFGEFDEGTGIGKAALRKMQAHSTPGGAPGHL
jgi:hypothetical protein